MFDFGMVCVRLCAGVVFVFLSVLSVCARARVLVLVLVLVLVFVFMSVSVSELVFVCVFFLAHVLILFFLLLSGRYRVWNVYDFHTCPSLTLHLSRANTSI